MALIAIVVGVRTKVIAESNSNLITESDPVLQFAEQFLDEAKVVAREMNQSVCIVVWDATGREAASGRQPANGSEFFCGTARDKILYLKSSDNHVEKMNDGKGGFFKTLSALGSFAQYLLGITSHVPFRGAAVLHYCPGDYKK